MAEEAPKQGYGYGKKPLWQWIIMYVIIGAIVYGLVYYFVFAKKGGYDYNSGGGSASQNTQPNSPYNYSP